MRRCELILGLAAFLAGGPAAASESVLQRAGQAVERAAKRSAEAVERGAQLVNALVRGADWMGRKLGRGRDQVSGLWRPRRGPVVATSRAQHLPLGHDPVPGGPAMRPALAAVILTLAGPAMAEQAGPLPPPVPRPAEAAPGPQPGLGERTGAAIDRAVDQTGQALQRAAEGTSQVLGRAMRWTGEKLQGAGTWAARLGERLTGPETPPPASAAPPGR
jgi:hypothetical protein